jgi:hypothetical protein
MTRTEHRALWAIALSHLGAQSLEQKVLGYLNALLDELGDELSSLVSAEGLAQLAGLLLSNIETGERPLLGPLRAMNRHHLRVLRLLHDRLTISLLADLPAGVIPKRLLALKVEVNLGL